MNCRCERRLTKESVAFRAQHASGRTVVGIALPRIVADACACVPDVAVVAFKPSLWEKNCTVEYRYRRKYMLLFVYLLLPPLRHLPIPLSL